MMSIKMLQLAYNWRQPRRITSASPLDEGLPITIRFAYPDDAVALHRLAALDGQAVPGGPLLVAEVAGELWAAVTVEGEARSVADPFRHTAALVELLSERADRLVRRSRRPHARHATSAVAWR